MEIIDKKKLERILVAKWADFIDIRKLRTFIQETAVEHLGMSQDCVVYQISASRFQPCSDGFLLWLEVMINQQNKKVNSTMEFILKTTGEISYRCSTH